MSRPYRDTFTVTRKPDGTFEAKLHGYPFYYAAPTAEACMREAGRAMDQMAAMRDKFAVAVAAESPRP